MIQKVKSILSVRLVLMVLFLSLSIQTDVVCQDKKEKYESYDTKREEIQRYFGYELLLYRYLSVPYDLSVNTTQSGNFVEIGFLFIIFIPILLLLLLVKKPIYYWLFLLYLAFLWVISTSNSFVFSHQKAKVDTTTAALDSYIDEVAFSQEPLDIIVGKMHLASRFIYSPLERIGYVISGDQDHITYPFLFMWLIILSLGLLHFTKGLDKNLRYFFALSWLYFFYWATFGGGIIWYGYILIPLFYVVIFKLFDVVRRTNFTTHKILYPIFIALSVFWIFMASVDRVSYIQPNITAEHLGKGIFNPVFFDYACGKITESEAIDKMYPGIGSALAKLNQDDDSYIWRVGTSISYFIDNNSKRVVMDNQLGLFHPLNYTYPDKQELVDVMKASKFKYLIIDLNTAQIDQTPNKTLTTKYNNLIEFVTDNPRVKLLATDRVLARMKNGKQENYLGFDGAHVYRNGRYAIFEFI